MRVLTLGNGARGILAGGIILLVGTSASAAPLDKGTCLMLQGERMQLELAGVRDGMAKGPEWAAVNLPAARLKDIERLIELDEQVTFRCPELIAAAATDPAVVPLPKRKPAAGGGVPPPMRKPGTGQ